MRRFAIVTLAAGALFAFGTPLASAQDEDPEEVRLQRARDLFAQGIELGEQGNFQQAAASFREALALHEAPAIKYNLASALFELDEPVEAALLVAEVLEDPETPREVQRPAEVLRDRIAAQVGQLSVQLAGDTEGVSVTVDGEPLAPEMLGQARPVRVGAHTIVAHRGDRELVQREVRVRAGQLASLDLAIAPTPEEAAAAGSGEPAGGEPSLASDWRLWVGVGAGVVVIVTLAVIIAVAAGGTQSPIRGNYDPAVLRFP